jgi:ATP-dependent RNA helicase DDX56/DBP9
LLPKEGKKALTDNVGFVPFKKEDRKRGHKRGKPSGRSFKVGGRKRDPLKTFKVRRK